MDKPTAIVVGITAIVVGVGAEQGVGGAVCRRVRLRRISRLCRRTHGGEDREGCRYDRVGGRKRGSRHDRRDRAGLTCFTVGSRRVARWNPTCSTGGDQLADELVRLEEDYATNGVHRARAARLLLVGCKRYAALAPIQTVHRERH
jgi:hypothetical protein